VVYDTLRIKKRQFLDVDGRPERRSLSTEVLSSLTLRRLMSFIYGAPILDVSRSHTTTQHSR